MSLRLWINVPEWLYPSFVEIVASVLNIHTLPEKLIQIVKISVVGQCVDDLPCNVTDLAHAISGSHCPVQRASG